MACSQLPKRQVTLDLSQLQKYPSKKYVIAMILPFKAEDVYPSFREQAIKETKKRWAWFSHAQKKDHNLSTKLGILDYLPWENRQVVFGMVLHCYLEKYGTVSPTYWENHEHLCYQSRYGYIREAINK